MAGKCVQGTDAPCEAGNYSHDSRDSKLKVAAIAGIQRSTYASSAEVRDAENKGVESRTDAQPPLARSHQTITVRDHGSIVDGLQAGDTLFRYDADAR